MDNVSAATSAKVLPVRTHIDGTRPITQASTALRFELMAPGHLYNPRTGTGIEWLSPNQDTGAPGIVRLWSRAWNGQPTIIAEAEHNTGTAWEYWYDLQFAGSFPQVTHWWFGDAWTGHVQIWEPEAVGIDPESGAPILSGWLRFGSEMPEQVDDAPALLWSVVLTSPPRVYTPSLPMSATLNLPLQLLLAKGVLELLGMVRKETQHHAHAHSHSHPVWLEQVTHKAFSLLLTSLVKRSDLHRAFPTEFPRWRLDVMPTLTPREALCRIQGLEPTAVSANTRFFL